MGIQVEDDHTHMAYDVVLLSSFKDEFERMWNALDTIASKFVNAVKTEYLWLSCNHESAAI